MLFRSPEHSLWPSLQNHLPPRKPIWPKWTLATAASAAIAITLFQTGMLGYFKVATQELQTSTHRPIEQLINQSAQLESAYYVHQDDNISSATVIAANLMIEDQLRAIDSQLAAQPDSPQALILWQQRIDALSQGLALNRSNAYLNAKGQRMDLALASTN